MSLPPLVDANVDLSVDEVRRYSRHLIIPDVGMAGQKRLKNAKVLCVDNVTSVGRLKDAICRRHRQRGASIRDAARPRADSSCAHHDVSLLQLAVLAVK